MAALSLTPQSDRALSLFEPVDLKGRVSSDVFAELVPGARVVKALSQCLIIVDEMAESINKQGPVGIVGMLRIDGEEWLRSRSSSPGSVAAKTSDLDRRGLVGGL
jgi:hypothetical protein